MRSHVDPSSILLVCVSPRGKSCSGESFNVANSAAQAMDLLRVLQFDLVLTSLQLPDVTPWDWLDSLHAAWPWQKWALADGQITSADELKARTLGAVALFDRCPSASVLLDLAKRFRGARPAKRREVAARESDSRVANEITSEIDPQQLASAHRMAIEFSARATRM